MKKAFVRNDEDGCFGAYDRDTNKGWWVGENNKFDAQELKVKGTLGCFYRLRDVTRYASRLEVTLVSGGSNYLLEWIDKPE